MTNGKRKYPPGVDEYGPTAKTLFSMFMVRLLDDICDACAIAEIVREGDHIVYKYRSGERSELQTRRYPGEVLCGPTPYERIAMNEDIDPLYPVPFEETPEGMRHEIDGLVKKIELMEEHMKTLKRFVHVGGE